MNRIVVDASVLLALMQREPGSEKLPPDSTTSLVASTVNLAEVQGKLVSRGWTSEEAWQDATGMIDVVVPFSPDHAKIAGSLIAQTRPLGLSLGDRASLALALELDCPVYTADRSWKNLRVGVKIHVIR